MHASFFSAVSLSPIFIRHLSGNPAHWVTGSNLTTVRIPRLVNWEKINKKKLRKIRRINEKEKEKKKERKSYIVLSTIVCHCDRVATQSPAIPGHPSRKPPPRSSPVHLHLHNHPHCALHTTNAVGLCCFVCPQNASRWGLVLCCCCVCHFLIFLSSGSRLGNIKPHPSISPPPHPTLFVDTRLLLIQHTTATTLRVLLPPPLLLAK